MKITTLTVDGDEITTTVHRDSTDAIKELRDRFESDGEYHEDVLEWVTATQGVCVYIEEHDVSVWPQWSAEKFAVETTYNTEHDGAEVPEDAHEFPRTLHGPFCTEAEAVAWMNDRPDDTDVREMITCPLNSPKEQS